MSEKGFRIEVPVHVTRKRRGRKALANGEALKVEEAVPRVARLLALAHKWEGMVRRGEVPGYSGIASRHGLSRARVSHICNLTLLAPNLQEASLFPSKVEPRLRAHLLAAAPSEPLWEVQTGSTAGPSFLGQSITPQEQPASRGPTDG